MTSFQNFESANPPAVAANPPAVAANPPAIAAIPLSGFSDSQSGNGICCPKADMLSSLGFPPPFWRRHRPHNNRRAKFHNYKAPGYYMITISKAPGAPSFSSIHAESYRSCESDTCRFYKGAVIKLTKTGLVIEDELQSYNNRGEFELGPWVIMPDHIHVLWRVKMWIEKDVGFHIGRCKSHCTKVWREISGIKPYANGDSPVNEEPGAVGLFSDGFNDRIVFDEAGLERLRNYINDNPRRRLMVILRPGIFSRAHRVRILDREFDVFGNFQLLKDPTIAPAIVSSRYTADERKYYERLLSESMRTGGVLISPFISAAERVLLKQGLETGCKIIRIIPDGMGERYKPGGLEFELCAQGRLLHIGLPRVSAHREALRRDACLRMNALARWIASHPAETMALINGMRM